MKQKPSSQHTVVEVVEVVLVTVFVTVDVEGLAKHEQAALVLASDPSLLTFAAMTRCGAW